MSRSELTAIVHHSFAALVALLLLCAPSLAEAPGGGGRLLRESDLEPIANLTQAEIKAGRIPGAVILIGTRDRVVYRRAFGHRMHKPKRVPMTVDTIFDLASLTKVVATTSSVMQLIDRGKLKLDDPIVKYWPQFGSNGKGTITTRNLLTHYSGLRADLDLSREWSGYDTAMNMIVAEKPLARPGTRYRYSDVNFEILGELVRRVTGSTLASYCRKNIFTPLSMLNTRFLPPPTLRDRIAPTQDLPGRIHWADVHDATARWMGGMSGHAGLFSTAADLAIYARMVLNGGAVDGVRVLSERSVREMTTRQSPPDGDRARGFGWDMGGPDGYTEFPDGSFGHLGFTGTMIWIDPGPGIYAIVLTHRVYPDGKGDADPLRKAVIELLANALRRPVQAARG